MRKLRRARSGRGAGKHQENGASLIEFAVAMPLLLILVLGIIEFGFLLAQMNEIRHGAREGARYAAVSRPDYNGDSTVGDEDDVLEATCDAVDLPGATIEVSLSGGPSRYDYGTVTVEAETNSLSSAPIISSLLPDTISNDATFRLEQDANWSALSLTSCP